MKESALSTFRFPENTCIAQAQPKVHGAVTLASPGIEVMTDLAQVKAATIDPRTTLDRAEQVMIHHGVRSLFVLVATFKKLQRSHLLVVQAASGQGAARIRGVVSLTQLERQLGRAVIEVMPQV